MDLLLLDVLAFVARIIPTAYVVSFLLLAVAAVYDVIKKKFYWAKWALVLVGVVILITIIEIATTYNVANSYLK